MSIAESQTQIAQNKRISRNEKFLVLHHELLYPAFLGAVLFEFAKKVFPGLLPIDFHWLASNVAWFTLNLRWSLTALWFMLYFTVAFLALHDTQKCAKSKEHFGWIPFLANFAEIAVILLVFVAISPTPPTPSAEEHTSEPLKLKYEYIFFAWMLIPVTAAISNYSSRRIVHGTISLLALLSGCIGLCLNGWIDWEHYAAYWVLLVVMYLIVAIYCRYVFRPAAITGCWWLKFKMRDNCRWPGWVS
jgi:hypothetical protein